MKFNRLFFYFETKEFKSVYFLVQNSIIYYEGDDNMFLDIIIKRFGYNTPIFTQEILDLFSFYSRPRVFQLIKEA